MTATVSNPTPTPPGRSRGTAVSLRGAPGSLPARPDRRSPVLRPAPDGKPRTYFVNGEVLAQVLAAPAPAPGSDATPACDVKRPVRVQRIDDRVGEVRANVQDAARAVLVWLAAVLEHDDGAATSNGASSLDDVLRRCLRPSADPADVNYAAMAQDIRRVTGIDLTAKRVQTAVRHLRHAAAKSTGAGAPGVGWGEDTPTPSDATSFHTDRTPHPSPQPPRDPLEPGLTRLRSRIADHFALLTGHGNDAGHPNTATARELGIDLLAAVRAAAARVIDRGFGEHITDTVDLSDLEGRFLGYVRDAVAGNDETAMTNDETSDEGIRRSSFVRRHSLHADFRRLLLTLSDHPLAKGAAAASIPGEHDVKLVMHGSRIVAALLGPDSLPGVLAHLNGLVVGRDLIGTDLYVAEMLRLAHTAEQLHHDPPTQQLLRWCRRQPADAGRKLPGAVRVASYARSNAATRLYERCFLGTIDPAGEAPLIPTMRGGAGSEVRGPGSGEDATTPGETSATSADPPPAPSPQAPPTYLALADRVLHAMETTDAGFTLTLTTRLLAHTTHAHLTGDDTAAAEYFRGLGEAKTLDRLEALIKFDNGDAIVAAARRLAESVYPALRQQLLVTR